MCKTVPKNESHSRHIFDEFEANWLKKTRATSPKICQLIPLYSIYIHMNTYGDCFEYD